jgi:hypothetical protein
MSEIYNSDLFNQLEPTPKAIATWVDDPAHCRHAAMCWLKGSFAIPNGVMPDTATIPLLGMEVVLKKDGTYYINDTTGG